jgi:hypothetical protein
MTPDATRQHELRLAMEHAQEVLRPRRWASLDLEQRRRLVAAIKPGMTDRELFQQFKRIAGNTSSVLVGLFVGVMVGVCFVFENKELFW